MRFTDVFLAFPRLVLALALAAALGPGIENAVIAIGLTAWPALRANGPRRNTRHPERRLRPCHAIAGRFVIPHRLSLYRSALPAIGHHQAHTGYVRNYHHRGEPGIFWVWALSRHCRNGAR